MKSKAIKLIYFILISIFLFFILQTNSISASRVEEPLIVNIHQHEYSLTTQEATCETDGYDIYTCVCGDTYTENVIHATGHT